MAITIILLDFDWVLKGDRVCCFLLLFSLNISYVKMEQFIIWVQNFLKNKKIVSEPEVYRCFLASRSENFLGSFRLSAGISTTTF